MFFRSDITIHPKPGNFLARVDQGTLIVPVELAKFAQVNHLRTAEALAGYADAFPTGLALSLGWGEPAVKAAVRRLYDQMITLGVLTAEDLVPAQSHVFGFGR